MKRVFLAVLLLCGFICNISAQNIQPKIMVIPYVKAGQDLRTILEADANKRVVLTKIKEGFDSRGATTVDFVARLKAANLGSVMASDNQSDIKTQILEGSGADIYVEAEIIAEKQQSGSFVRIILTAFEISTGNSLANKIGESGRFYTDDFGALGKKAVDASIDDFLNVIQMKFSEIVENGKSIVLDISIDRGSSLNFESELSNGDIFADAIEMWLSENAYKGIYHMQGSGPLRIIYDDVKIPLKATNGNNYTLAQFWMELNKFLRSVGVQASRNIQSSSLFVTIK